MRHLFNRTSMLALFFALARRAGGCKQYPHIVSEESFKDAFEFLKYCRELKVSQEESKSEAGL